MRTLGDIRETLPIKKFGSYIKVKERHVAVSQAKIFCSDALTHCCHFWISVYSDCGTVEACDAFGAESYLTFQPNLYTQGTDFLLAMRHTNKSHQDISEWWYLKKRKKKRGGQVRAWEPCIYHPNKRTKNIKRGISLRKDCLGITNHACSVCSCLTAFISFFLLFSLPPPLFFWHVTIPICMEIVS